ncbi:MAG: cellulase family glycosylhydrolase [Ignavibacteriaceae bacterium]|jgi:aryl-phospho-beta-D-glucosidase BglC (GH1 family)|nr:cellulase family glycosylhydrolase [Ignavibacteriaceae bacterium]
MKKIIFYLILLVLTSLTFSQNYSRTEGKEILDINGKPILLKGINLGNWLVPEGYMFKFKNTNSPQMIYTLFNQLIGPEESNNFWEQFRENYITEEDFKFIKESGFNSVRVPFNFRLFASEENPDVIFDLGFKYLDKAIDWGNKYKLYIILDMHCAPGGQTGDNIDDSYGYPFLFESKMMRKLTIDIWSKIANRYKTEKYLMGYDLLNEPIATYFDKTKLNPYLEPFYEELITEMRKYDSNHIMFIGGAQWNSDFSVFGPPLDNNSIYTFHKYWTATDKSVIQSYIDYSDQYKVPIWMGESGENNDQWIKEFRTTLEENNIGWCFWPYKKLDASSNVLSINKPEDYDLIINYAESDRKSYESIRNNKPDAAKINKILAEYLENIKMKNCKVNEGYLNALGLSEVK